MDFVIIANAWSAAEKNPTGKHQIALTLAEKGHRVLWIEGAGMRRPSATQSADRSRMVTKLVAAARGMRKARAGIWHTAPLIIPIPSNPFVRILNAIIYVMTAIVGSFFIGFRRPTLINFLPVVPLAERLWPWKAVYFCVDRWDQFDMYDTGVMTRVDEECCRYADTVLTTSNDLQTRCAPKNPSTHLMGHGVNWDHFSAPLQNAATVTPLSRPTDLPDGKIVGFFGLLSEWVDQNLLLALAHALLTPQPSPASLVLIGNADVDITSLKSTPNIHILGPKPFQDLPAYTAFFDVAIIPFIVNELTAAVNPIKLREMLAAGCPVVSTSLPEVAVVAQHNPFTDVTHTTEAFIAATLKRLNAPSDHETRKKISNTVKNETWSAKVDQILSIIFRLPK